MPSISSDDKPVNIKKINYVKVKVEQEVVVPANVFGYDDDESYDYVEAKNAKEAIDVVAQCQNYSYTINNLFEYISFDADNCKWKITITDYKEK